MTAITARPGRALPRWPLILIALPAAVAVWSGWVGLGTLCGFGLVRPLPGIADGFTINTAITLPVGVEAYGAYALGAWLTPGTAPAARTFARRSALGALALGMAGQVIYHLLTAARAAAAPWPVVMLVSCLPVLTLGMGGALTHLLRAPGPAVAGEPDAAPAIPADTAPATAPAIPAATAADSTADTAADSTPDTAAAARRAPARTRRGPSTAARVAALRDRHPDMPAADIARRLKLSDRTVRRYLSAAPAGEPRAIAA